MNVLNNPAGRRLDSWKEIADYLGCDVRTAMRWEQEAGLPVHRVPGGRRRVVFSLVDELEQWAQTRNQHEAQRAAHRGVPVTHRSLWAAALVSVLLMLAVILALVRLHPRAAMQEEVVFALPTETFRFTKYTIRVPEGGNGLLLAQDMNGDGLPDLVEGGAPAGKLAVLWNKGDGKFADPVYLSGCRDSVSPTSGDFDGDGNTDLAVACFGTSQVEVWWGDGKGNFGSPARAPVGPGPVRLESADFSNKGVEAIIAGSDVGPVTVLTGHRDRTFTTQQLDVDRPFTAATGDFNGDGYSDVAVLCAMSCHALHVFLNRGNGTVAPGSVVDVASASWQVVTDDLNQDGSPDLIVTSSNGDTQAILGNGDGTFQPARSLMKMNAPMLVPFTQGERKYVLVMEVWRGELQLWRIDHELQPEVSGKASLARSLRSAVIADMNGDGLQDFAFLLLKEGRPNIVVLIQKRNG